MNKGFNESMKIGEVRLLVGLVGGLVVELVDCVIKSTKAGTECGRRNSFSCETDVVGAVKEILFRRRVLNGSESKRFARIENISLRWCVLIR